MKFKIDYYFDAFWYLYTRCSGRTCVSRFDELCLSFPDNAEELREKLLPIIELEKRIDAAVSLPEDRLRFFFTSYPEMKKVPEANDCLASLLLHSVLRDRPAPDALGEFLLSKTDGEIMANFCSFLDTPGDATVHEAVEPKAFFQAVNSKDFGNELKLRVFDAFFNYSDYVRELIAYIDEVIIALRANVAPCAALVDTCSNFGSEDEFLADIDRVFGFNMNGAMLQLSKLELFVPILACNTFMVFFKRFSNDVGEVESYSASITLGVMKQYIMALQSTVPSYDKLAALLKAISDPKRLEILHLLCETSYYGGELSEKLELHPTTISHHMSKLIAANMVNCDLVTVKTYFTINRSQIEATVQMLKKLLEL